MRAPLPPATGPVIVEYRDLGIIALVIPEEDITEHGARQLELSSGLRRRYFPDRNRARADRAT